MKTLISECARAIQDGGIRVRMYKNILIMIADPPPCMEAFVHFDSPWMEQWEHLFDGAALKVLCNDSRIPREHRRNKAKEYKHYLMNRLFDILKLPEDFRPCDDWKEVVL